MSAHNSLVNFEKRRIETLRNTYNDTELTDNNKKITARKDLIRIFKLSEYEEKISLITGHLAKRQLVSKEFSIIYFVFTKAFDFLISYDNTYNLREKFLDYCDLLNIFFTRSNKKDVENVHSSIFNLIKAKNFDIESLLFKINKENNNEKFSKMGKLSPPNTFGV